ncbi:hypothetical protein B0H14DRAFT_3877020 [Mycena olivaceomarginata]|nr:hypothetical protein B0H14DRAFT_3877020 [Mycena olivaceomarginata]
MTKVGKIEVFVCGLDDDGNLRRKTALSGQEAEGLLKYHLARTKGCDGSDVEFGAGWEEKEVDVWIRGLFPDLFEYLDLVYGSKKRHWVLVKKDRFSVFAMKRETYTSNDMEEAKGSAARGWRECAVRVATCHAVPSAVYKDWPGAIEKARTGERLPSESPSDTETKPKSKHSGRQAKGKAKAEVQSLSSSSESPESELSELEEQEQSGAEDIVKKEPGTSTEEPRRRSARFVKPENAAAAADSEIKFELNDEQSTSCRSSLSSGFGMPAQDHGPDESEPELKSDFSNDSEGRVNLEESHNEWEVGAEDWKNLDDEQWYSKLQESRRKRSVTLLSDASDEEDSKRHKTSEATQYTACSKSHPKFTHGSTTSVSIISPVSNPPAQSGIGSTPAPSHPLKFAEPARPKRGFGVPKAAFDPWNSK